jgi:molybdopterin converting factor small subunit
MPQVSVCIRPPLSERLGTAQGGRRAIILEQAIEPGESVRDVFSRLAEQYPAFRVNALEPETDRLVPQILLMVNGRLLTAPDAYDTPLEEGAEIDLLPAYAGG